MGSTLLRLARWDSCVARELGAAVPVAARAAAEHPTVVKRLTVAPAHAHAGTRRWITGARAGTSSERVRPPIEAPAGLATEPRAGVRRRPGGAGGRGKGVSSARGGIDSFALWRGGCLPTDGHWEARSHPTDICRAPLGTAS